MPVRALRASLANARRYRANPVTFYRSLTASEDATGYRAVVPFEFFGPNVLVNDPDLVRIVLTDPSGVRFGKDGLRFYTVLRRMLGASLFTVEGERHNAQRRALQPILQPRSFERCVPAAMSSAAQRLRQEWSAGPSRVVDVEEAAGRTALHLLADALAGPAHGGRVREVGRLAGLAEEPLLRVLKAPVLFPAWLPTPTNRRLRHASRELRRQAGELLALDVPPGSLLHQMRRRLDDGLLDELVTLVVGGHRSTAAAIAFSLYLLATHPPAARRLAEEARAVLGDTGRPATMADLPALPYAAAVAAEAIRLYPPVWVIVRRVVAPTPLPGYGVLPAGTVLHVCPHTLHRNPAHWPDPDRFLPDRFLPAGSAGAEDGRHRFAYVPFGGGPHKCIGNHFALAATTIVLATLAPVVRFAPPATAVRVTARSFTAADGGLRLSLLRG